MSSLLTTLHLKMVRVLAFRLYCRLPFGLFHHGNPDIVELSKLIDRTPSAVAMKLSNFASFDPIHRNRGVKGLSNTSKADEAAWREFTSNWESTVWDSEVLLVKLNEKQTVRNTETRKSEPLANELADWDVHDVGVTQVEEVTKVRIGQRFFRDTVLANYRSRCCVCGMPIPDLLIASHIIPWKDREDLRLNPHNGLCMCTLHDKAFDAGFLTIDEQYRVTISRQVSTYLPNESVEANIVRHHGKEILLPDKFMPDREFLKYHSVTYFLTEGS